MLRQSVTRTQRLSGLATSICRFEPIKCWYTHGGRLKSTSPASTQSHGANTDLEFTSEHGLRPAVRPLASSPPGHSSPDDTVKTTSLATKAKKCGQPRRFMLATLDPARLDSSCFLDLSGRIAVKVYDTISPEPPCFLRISYGVSDHAYDRFLPDTRGFLYLHRDAHDPLLSHIRFRVAKDHDPARSFASGHDLTYGSGFLWYISLMSAMKNDLLRKTLMSDGFVDDALLAQLQAPPPYIHSHRLKRVISALNQPFIIEFKNMFIHFVVRVAGGERVYRTQGPLIHYKKNSQFRMYEAGAAMCRLERSTLPQHAGRRILVMRLLKILQPPKPCPDMLPRHIVSIPAEGELFTSVNRVWHRDVDKGDKSAEILRLLLNTPDDDEPASDQS